MDLLVICKLKFIDSTMYKKMLEKWISVDYLDKTFLIILKCLLELLKSKCFLFTGT